MFLEDTFTKSELPWLVIGILLESLNIRIGGTCKCFILKCDIGGGWSQLFHIKILKEMITFHSYKHTCHITQTFKNVKLQFTWNCFSHNPRPYVNHISYKRTCPDHGSQEGYLI